MRLTPSSLIKHRLNTLPGLHRTPCPNQTLLKGRAKTTLTSSAQNPYSLQLFSAGMLQAKSKRRIAGMYSFSFPLHPRTVTKLTLLTCCRNQPLPAGEQLLSLLTAQGPCLSPFTLTLLDTLRFLFIVQSHGAAEEHHALSSRGLNNGCIPQHCLGSYKERSLN